MSTDPLLQANKTSFEIYNLEEKRKRFCLNINTKSLEYLIIRRLFIDMYQKGINSEILLKTYFITIRVVNY